MNSNLLCIYFEFKTNLVSSNRYSARHEYHSGRPGSWIRTSDNKQVYFKLVNYAILKNNDNEYEDDALVELIHSFDLIKGKDYNKDIELSVEIGRTILNCLNREINCIISSNDEELTNLISKEASYKKNKSKFRKRLAFTFYKEEDN